MNDTEYSVVSTILIVIWAAILLYGTTMKRAKESNHGSNWRTAKDYRVRAAAGISAGGSTGGGTSAGGGTSLMGSHAFDGPPLVAGTIKGYRTFLLNSDGTLRSIVHEHKWKEGENTACCMKPERTTEVVVRLGAGANIDVSSSLPNNALTYTASGNVVISGEPVLDIRITASQKDVEITQQLAPHKQAKCSCGFYAYTKGENEYAVRSKGQFYFGPSGLNSDDPRIHGIIEGYGEVQVGPLGFRAKKAKLTALYYPNWSEPIQPVEKILPSGLPSGWYTLDDEDKPIESVEIETTTCRTIGDLVSSAYPNIPLVQGSHDDLAKEFRQITKGDTPPV